MTSSAASCLGWECECSAWRSGRGRLQHKNTLGEIMIRRCGPPNGPLSTYCWWGGTGLWAQWWWTSPRAETLSQSSLIQPQAQQPLAWVRHSVNLRDWAKESRRKSECLSLFLAPTSRLEQSSRKKDSAGCCPPSLRTLPMHGLQSGFRQAHRMLPS